MKAGLFLSGAAFILFGSVTCAGQAIDFPDPNMKLKLLASGPGNNIAVDMTGNNFKIDANNNGEIEISEAFLVRDLNISPFSGPLIPVVSVEGISYFTNLQSLNLGLSAVTAPVDLSGLANLKYFSANAAPVEEINVTGCIALEDITASALTSIDASTLVNLKNFTCSGCSLIDLDLSQNALLDELYCDCDDILTLNIQNGSMENVIQLYDTANLQSVCCDTDQYSQVFMAVHNTFPDISDAVIYTNCSLGHPGFDKNNISFYPNPASHFIRFDTTESCEKLEIYDAAGRLVDEKKAAAENQYDISGLQSGHYFMKAYFNGMAANHHLIKL